MMMQEFQKLYRKALENNEDPLCFQDTLSYLQKQLENFEEYSLLGTTEEQIRVFLSVIDSPFLLGLYQAFIQEDMSLLNDVLYQTCRHLVFESMGTQALDDHSTHYPFAFKALVANEMDIFESLYPKDLGLTTNGIRINKIVSNLLIALYYQKREWKRQAKEKAIAFLALKCSTQFERKIVLCLLSLLEFVASDVSKHLNDISALTRRKQNTSPLWKQFSLEAHALYHFAHQILPKKNFMAIEIPKDRGFIKELALWNQHHNFPKGKLFLTYTGKLEGMNTLLSMPIPGTTLTHHASSKGQVLDAYEFQTCIKYQAKRLLEKQQNL